jgi:hypothetical protein
MMDQKTRDRILELLACGLATGGAHHKQWYLEQILMVVGQDVGWPLDFIIRYMRQKEGLDWEPGVAPEGQYLG